MKKNLQKKLVEKNLTNYFSRMILSLILSLVFLSSEVNAQSCPLACDDEVNVSLDENCQAVITPDILLEGEGEGCVYTVVVFGTNGLPLPSSPQVDGLQLGKRLVVAIYLGNNSCWGHIIVEDKFRPTINCARPDTIFCTQRNFVPRPDTATDNCTPVNQLVKHTVYDSMIMYTDCMNERRNNLIGYRKIACYYTDLSGNRSDTCISYIYFKKFLEQDITWPRDTVFTCKEYNDSIPQPAQSGVPNVNGNPLFPSWGVCKAAVSFEDQILPQCPKSFKVLRTWTVIDWCMPSGQNIYRRYQVIKVIDDRGPIIKCASQMEISTDVSSCTGTAIVPPPTIIDECSKVTIQVGYKILSATGSPTFEGTSSLNVFKLPNGFYRISGLPLGLSWVVFRVTDECGNFTDCATEVNVVDKVPPIPVCDQKTIVSLTIDGTARIDAFTFDDGSLDNCSIDRYEVRRMDNGAPCDTLRRISFAPSVYFCCADVGKTIMVALRVWDKAGNNNICMVEVMVQDKLAPLVFCPPNITVSCEFAYSDLSVFGTVVTNIADRKPIVIKDLYKTINGEPIDGYAYDGCGVTVQEFVSPNIKCGIGTIYRTFIATDPSGLSNSCTQIITIRDTTPNNVYVIWPIDYISTTTCMNKLDLDPSKTGYPTVIGEDKCSNIFKNYEDKFYVKDPDACLKVIRTWTVIDWCLYDPNSINPKGYYSWKQILKIINTQAPVFINPCKDITVDVFGPNCGGNIEIIGRAHDDCTDSLDLVWYHTIDLNNDKIADPAFTGPGPIATAWYPVGTHRITLSVTDACGNVSICSYLLTVRDAKKPTPYCITSITTTVMPSTKNIEIWARDFNLNSEDNCTPKDKLKYYFLVNNTFVPSMIFDCANVGKNLLRIYVVDENGNSDYCETTMEIQDPNLVCKGTGLTIQGTLTNAKNQVMQNVSVFLERINPTGSALVYSNHLGVFTFNSVTANTDYTIGVEKNFNSINGVSTADIVAIQKHILGKQIFNTPFKIIAADVNNSSTITSADISEIRKLLLGVTTEFAKNKSWRFVPKAFIFVDPTNPFPFNERIAYNGISRNEMNSNFIGVKIGDVTEDSDPSTVNAGIQSRTNDKVNISTQDRLLTVGQEQIIPIEINQDFVLSGIQLGISIDNEKVEIVRIESAGINISEENYRLTEQGLRLSLAPEEVIKLNLGMNLFNIVLKVKKSAKLSEVLHLDNNMLNSEIYAEDVSNSQLELEMRSNKVENVDTKPTLVQNIPNPFTEQTTVSFTIPKTQKVNFDIFDLNGKIVYSLSNTYTQGKHDVLIKRSKLNDPGIYYLKMSTTEFSETKKMVLLK
ncbi:MAG: T9SS type A sorting domain-containing protein [Saprospiraceae bacterium]